VAEQSKPVPPWTRITILLAGLVSIAGVSYLVTGEILPSNQRDQLIFQNALLLIVLGSAILETKFTKPGDSVVNGLMGSLTLLPVYGLPTMLSWWLIFGYCAAVFAISTTCVAVSSGPSLIGWRKEINDLTYKPAVVLGRSRVLFSILFLYAVFSFYGVQSSNTAILVVFWGIFISLWPLGIPELLAAFQVHSQGTNFIGRVLRTDAPNIIHAAISPDASWQPGTVKVLQQADGKQRYIIPLFSQSKDAQILGTGISVADVEEHISDLEPACLYEPLSLSKSAEELLGEEKESKLVGFVEQDSSISQLRFHTWDPTACFEGMLVWSRVGASRVYYQITEGLTQEEGLEADRHGYQIAIASQLGIINCERGFEKFPWLPAMNSPVFKIPKGFGTGLIRKGDSDFQYGVVPETSISVIGQFADMLEYHTAILGVTGAGKTELAFELLRHAIAHGTKVICIDLTARYQGRLLDLNPQNLSISATLLGELGSKLFDVETGKYGAGEEKKALKQCSDKLRADISSSLTGFLESKESDKKLGIITLDEISNTRATIFITELYLTCLLNFAKDNPDKCPRVLLVVEEAHTVMPEANTMGLGDFDAKGLVAKIAQIALQGRKYGVGLLVITQRTATVSKTVLTQCNTVVSFSCFDDTSLGFLENYFGKTHTAAIPNLQFLQAVVFGKGVKSQRPLIVQIPFDREKEEIGKAKPRAETAVPS
jgi:uncharacterized protein